MASNEGGQNRREFLRNGLRLLGLAAVGGVLTGIGSRTLASPTVWQIDRSNNDNFQRHIPKQTGMRYLVTLHGRWLLGDAHAWGWRF